MPAGPSVLYKRTPKLVLRVFGEDVFSFLQGQFSNDLQHPPGRAIYGLWLNQKGKIVADSTVLRLADHEFLVVGSGVEPAVIKQRLEDYIVADDVSVSVGESIGGSLTVWGEGCGLMLERILGYLPETGSFWQRAGVWIYPERRMAGETYRVLAPVPALQELHQQLTAGLVTVADENAFALARITAGIPSIPEDLGPADLPNEGGLEATAISFTKGCYLGQEVMARLKNLGQVRRRLFVLHGPNDRPPARAPLFQGGIKVGELRSVARKEDGFVAFAMLSLVNLNRAQGLCLQADGPVSVWFGSEG